MNAEFIEAGQRGVFHLKRCKSQERKKYKQRKAECMRSKINEWNVENMQLSEVEKDKRNVFKT